MQVTTEIKIKLNDKEIILSEMEAKELLDKLKQLFHYSNPIVYPISPLYSTWWDIPPVTYTTSTDTIIKKGVK